MAVSSETRDSIEKSGLSRAAFAVRLPLTFSQIMLLRGLAFTGVSRQTGPHYEGSQARATLTVETGPEGTVISFLDEEGGGAGEVGFTDVKFRTDVRHFLQATGTFNSGDFTTVKSGQEATLEISDAGFRLIGHDSDVNKKYNARSHHYYGGHGHNSGRGNNRMGFTLGGPGNMSIMYSYAQDHIYNWSDAINNSVVTPFFGEPHQPRLQPQIEAMIGYDNLKKAVFSAGGRADSDGALYWGIDADEGRIYTTGYNGEGENTGAPKLWRGTIYTTGANRFGSATIPYRPFGDAIRNRFRNGSDAGFGLDTYGRPYIVLKWSWGYVRYTTVSFTHGVMPRDSIPTQGSKATKTESTEYVPSWELNFELDPLNEHDRVIVKQWYETWQQANKATAQMPRVPTKGELYSWWMSHVVNSDRDITNEEAVLAQSLLED